MKFNNEKGITLITMIVMIVIMAIIATVSIVGGVQVVREAKGQVKEDNLASVKNLVNRESAKANTSGVLTPANATFYGTKDALLEGETIGEEWYYLDEIALKEMGIEYANETYVVNYKLNVVIPLSEEANLHDKINYYNNEY